MNRSIFINTSNENIYGKNNSFEISLNQDGLILDRQKNYYIGLHTLNMSYAWDNISDKFGNNSFRYSSDNGNTWKTVTFMTGTFTYSDIATFISNYLEKNSDDKEGIQLFFVSSVKKCYIELKPSYQIDFRSNLLFGELLGYNTILTSSSYSNIEPNITNGIDSIIIKCSLVSNSIYNTNIQSSVIYTFSTSDLKISYPFTKKEDQIIYNKINTTNIQKFNIQIYDSKDRLLELGNSEVSMILILKD